MTPLWSERVNWRPGGPRRGRWTVTVLRPSGEDQLAHVHLAPKPADVPAARREALAREGDELVRRALGRAPQALRRLYVDVLLGSSVHNLSLVRALAGQVQSVEHVAMWPDGPQPPSISVDATLPGGARLAIWSHYLDGYPGYREEVQLHRWRRTFLPPLPGGDELETLEVSLFDLAETFFRILKRKEAETTRVIRGRDVSLETKTRELLGVLEGGASLDFNAYFEDQDTVADALVSFFALLELIKTHLVYAVQDDLFQTIRVWLRRDRTPGHKP